MDRIEDMLEDLLKPTKEDEFLAVLTKTIKMLGFEYYAYGLRVSQSITKSNYLLRNNYPTAWQQCYEERGYVEVDPTVRHGLISNSPIIWNETLFKRDREFWEEASSFGLKLGWAQSAFLNRSATGMLTLARSDDELSDTELLRITPYIALLNQTVQIVFQRIHIPQLMPELNNPLSTRELEVIKWCAEGKTSDEIRMILNITERTVNFHVANIIEKFNVTNKTAAAVRALQIGLI